MIENLLTSLKVFNKHEISEQQLNQMFVASDVKFREARIQNDKSLIQTKGVTDSKFFFQKENSFSGTRGKNTNFTMSEEGGGGVGGVGAVVVAVPSGD